MLTKGAIGNLINRYRAVLKKCNLINTFGSLAVASMLIAGGAAVAQASEYSEDILNQTIEYTGSYLQGGLIEKEWGEDITVSAGNISNNNVSVAGKSSSYLQGGVINNTSSNGNNITVEGTSFENNNFKSEGYLQGGIIVNEHGTSTINNAKFNENTFTAKNFLQGGIINNDYSGHVNISGTDFYKNTSKSNAFLQGGLILTDGGGSVNIENSNFISNTAESTETVRGGIILIADTNNDVTISGSNFEGNSVKGNKVYGGVVYNEKNNTLNISNSDFKNNTVTSDTVYGGVINNDDGGKLTFSGENTFDGNKTFLSDGTVGVSKDVYNSGSLTVKDGTTLMNSGYMQEGADSELIVSSGATLGIAMPDLGGVTAENGEALLALGQKLELNGGSLQVGDVTGSGDVQVAFGSDSMLVVDASAAVDGPAITGSHTSFVGEESKLYIANAKAGEEYTIFDTQASGDNTFWTADNIQAGRLIGMELDENGKLVATAKDASTVLPGVLAVNSLNALSYIGYANDSEIMGIQFLSRVMDDSGDYLSNDAQAIDTVNEVSRAAVTAGVQNTALRVADAGADQLAHHLSLSFFGKENNIHKDGVDIWATPMYGNLYTHGMTTSGTSVRGNYGGMTLGADALVGELMGGKVRMGAAINGGGGKSESKGTATSAENSYNFGGVSLYAGWNLDSLNVMASVGYTMADHDVDLSLPSALGMGNANADVDTNAFVADLRAEYQINTSVVDILPHAGVRYTALNTESHDLKINGSTLNSVASDTQHIVQFPIGVTLSKDIDVSGWNVKPLADVSVIPAAGEKKNTTKVSYSGINAVDGVNTRIMDSTSWSGMVGVQAEKGNFALGLNYGIQASSHETDQNVNLGFSWKF